MDEPEEAVERPLESRGNFLKALKEWIYWWFDRRY
jgi:hypothetical protein